MSKQFVVMGAAAIALVTGSLLAADVASVATLTITAGPHAGRYTIRSDKACTIGPVDKGDPDSFEATLMSEGMRKGQLATRPKELGTVYVDLPRLDAPHLGELKIDVAFGDPTAREGNGRMPGVLYTVDTRPDSALPEYERAVRGSAKLKGRGGAKLRRSGPTANVEFWGETPDGVRIDGTIECRSIRPDRSFY